MKDENPRRQALMDIAAEGIEEADADLFKEFPPKPRAHAPHLCFCRMGLPCPNKDSCPCVAGRPQNDGTATNQKGI